MVIFPETFLRPTPGRVLHIGGRGDRDFRLICCSDPRRMDTSEGTRTFPARARRRSDRAQRLRSADTVRPCVRAALAVRCAGTIPRACSRLAAPGRARELSARPSAAVHPPGCGYRRGSSRTRYNWVGDPSVRAAMDVDVASPVQSRAAHMRGDCFPPMAMPRAPALDRAARAAARPCAPPPRVLLPLFACEKSIITPHPDSDSPPTLRGGRRRSRPTLEGSAAAAPRTCPRPPLPATAAARWMAVWSDGAARQMRPWRSIRKVGDAGEGGKTVPSAPAPAPRRLAACERQRSRRPRCSSTSARVRARRRRRGGASDFRLVVQRTLAESAGGGSAPGEQSAPATLCGRSTRRCVRRSRGSGRGARGRAHLRDARPAQLVRVRVGHAYSIRMEAPHCVNIHKPSEALATGRSAKLAERSRPPRVRVPERSRRRARILVRGRTRTACWCSSRVTPCWIAWRNGGEQPGCEAPRAKRA